MSGWLGLAGRRALVVGAGAIGTACAEGLAAAGVRVCLADRDPDRLGQAATTGALADGATLTVTADVGDPARCAALVAQARAALGGFELFVHAVGRNIRKPVAEIAVGEWEEILRTNLLSAFALGQAAGAVLRGGGGRMVFVSPVSGLLAHPHHAPYAASKGGLNQLVKVMAVEWAPDGVGVNAIAPGYTETPLTAEHLARPGVRDALLARVPAGRLGDVDDLVGPVVFLCSPRSAYLTGQVLYVDGGRTLD